MANQGRWNLAGVVLLLVWVNMTPALAQSRPATSVQEALKGIKPSASPCKRADAKPLKPPKHTQMTELTPDLSCAITPNSLAQQLKSPKLQLIDTRSAEAFNNYRIDGAMNISAAELRSKPFLSDKIPVLVGDGKAERELYIECRRLKASGFRQAKVLRGGMPAWLASEQQTAGQPPNLEPLTALTPSELWVESQFQANLIVITKDQEALHKQIPGSLLVSDTTTQTLKSALNKHRKSTKTGIPSTVILVAGNNSDYQTLSQALKPTPLLTYTGTAQAYANHLAQQSAVWAAHARRPKQPPGCRR
jgi:rhodanese-related sulfurtransferase